MKKKYEITDRIIEYSVYVYIVFMFLSKGESIRNIIIFGTFTLWLLSLKHRGNRYLLKDLVAKLCWLYVGALFISALLSIDPLYSLSELKGGPRKFLLMFPVIATVMANPHGLKRVAYVSMFTSLIIVSLGYYSFIAHDLSVLKPDVPLMHVWHNKFAKYLNTLLPFAFVLFFIWKKRWHRVLFFSIFVLSVIALILSTSRGGYLAFLSMAIIWSVFLAKTEGYNLKKLLMRMLALALVVIVLSWLAFPVVQNRLASLSIDMRDVNGRIVAWEAAIQSVRQRPLLGWGYGKEIFHRDDIFENTKYKKRPIYRNMMAFDDPHNTFLSVLFHQGIVGLITYVSLIVLSIRVFWKEAFMASGVKSYILMACVSILVGNYIVHSMFTLLRLQDLAVVLGLGLAAKNIKNENSHN